MSPLPLHLAEEALVDELFHAVASPSQDVSSRSYVDVVGRASVALLGVLLSLYSTFQPRTSSSWCKDMRPRTEVGSKSNEFEL
jgi:hypothetical protein